MKTTTAIFVIITVSVLAVLTLYYALLWTLSPPPETSSTRFKVIETHTISDNKYALVRDVETGDEYLQRTYTGAMTLVRPASKN
mgnify:FL=1